MSLEEFKQCIKIANYVISCATPFILLCSLYNQRQAFLKQQIEDRFFKLIQLHRENVDQIEIKDRSGKKVFIPLLRELNIAYESIESICKNNGYDIKEQKKLNISYLAFFYGAVGERSEEMLRRYFSDKSEQEQKLIESLINELKTKRHSEKEDFSYEIFDGHQSRLGHYFRNLFQAVTYINEQKILNYDEKYAYVKILRAQISTQEQLLLCWNTISDLGQVWELKEDEINKKLITKYNLICNIPSGLSKYIDCQKYYPLVKYEESNQSPPDRKELEKKYR